MNIDELRRSGMIVLEAVCGSRSFGLATETSDTDIHGVYVASPRLLSALDGKPPQAIKDDRSNTEYWEMRQFLELLRDGKPNALELLHSPPEHVLYRNHKVMDILMPSSQFVSEVCVNTFYRYAVAQIDKARGLNKKVLNPMPLQRKGVSDFCSVIQGGQTYKLHRWLEFRGIEMELCGLAGLDGVPNTYSLYVQTDGAHQPWARGICFPDSNEVVLSSIPKGLKPEATLYWNKDGYSIHCKQHKEYWEWVNVRNQARYENTVGHGRGYDSKNMMHTFRLLHMGLEIARGEGVRVDRSHEREFLLDVKKGAFQYEDLLGMVDELSGALLKSGGLLPKQPRIEVVEEILFYARMAHWKGVVR